MRQVDVNSRVLKSFCEERERYATCRPLIPQKATINLGFRRHRPSPAMTEQQHHQCTLLMKERSGL